MITVEGDVRMRVSKGPMDALVSRRSGAVAAVLMALFAAVSAPDLRAQQPALLDVASFTLPNGLRVHLVEDHTSQVVAVNVWYDVGSRNERPFRTGFAHLFEHMMFQGSANVGKTEHGQLIERAGGRYNGSTQPDRTDYYNEVPSNRMNLALWLEADRMRSLAVTAENLKNQQEAVKEERRLRFDNQPYTGALIDSLPMLFDGERCFAYAHSMIGSMTDLEAATVEDVQEFFATYYAPNNATIVVAGDFDPARARQLIGEYFGDIPRGPIPPVVECAPQQATGREEVRRISDAKATLPAVLMAFRSVPPSHGDYPALSLLSRILGEGESSRLNRSLVRDAQVAVVTQGMHDPFGPMRAAGIFGVLAIANQGVAADTVKTLIAHELAKVSESVTTVELTKARNSWRAQTIFARQHALAITEAVHYAAMYIGAANAVNSEAARYNAVSVDDLRRVARTYLRPENSLTLLIVPEDR